MGAATRRKAGGSSAGKQSQTAKGTARKRAAKAGKLTRGEVKRPDEPAEEFVSMPKSDVDLLERLRVRAIQIGEFERVAVKAKEEYKIAKGNLDEARAEFVHILRGSSQDTPLTDFGEPDGWKRVPLVDVVGAAFEKKILDGSAGLIKTSTLGALAGFLSRNSLTDIRGIGRSAADKIEAKLDEFWRVNPHWSQEDR